MGNRGCIHRGREIVRPWATKRWIVCALEFKGWRAPKWLPGRWTPLFFYDEALALAAGHRPCALCRRSDYRRYSDAAGVEGADAIDALLHTERVSGGSKRTCAMAWRTLPAGAYVEFCGIPHVVLPDAIRPWSPVSGYGERRSRPHGGNAIVLTPRHSLRAMARGYGVQIAGC